MLRRIRHCEKALFIGDCLLQFALPLKTIVRIILTKAGVTHLCQNVATAIKTESPLADQPLKTKLEYRVIAVNKSGVGPPSNTVMVVL
jgi:hypothetical protein